MQEARRVDDEAIQRFFEVCEMTDQMLAAMSPAEKDRMQQRHLAAARGPINNFFLACELSDAMHAWRSASRRNSTQ